MDSPSLHNQSSEMINELSLPYSDYSKIILLNSAPKKKNLLQFNTNNLQRTFNSNQMNSKNGDYLLESSNSNLKIKNDLKKLKQDIRSRRIQKQSKVLNIIEINNKRERNRKRHEEEKSLFEYGEIFNDIIYDCSIKVGRNHQADLKNMYRGFSMQSKGKSAHEYYQVNPYKGGYDEELPDESENSYGIEILSTNDLNHEHIDESLEITSKESLPTLSVTSDAQSIQFYSPKSKYDNGVYQKKGYLKKKIVMLNHKKNKILSEMNKMRRQSIIYSKGESLKKIQFDLLNFFNHSVFSIRESYKSINEVLIKE